MKKRLVCLLCVAVLAVGSLAACGGKDDNKDNGKNTENVGNQNEDTEGVGDGTEAGTEGGEEVQFNPVTALDALLAANPAEDNYLVLSGIVGGWAPTLLVLDNDGNFIALVDYAGQATVNFAQGTYTENADGSITCEGTQYNTGEELIYEITVVDGTYSTTVAVPDTGSEGELTGTK